MQRGFPHGNPSAGGCASPVCGPQRGWERARPVNFVVAGVGGAWWVKGLRIGNGPGSEGCGRSANASGLTRSLSRRPISGPGATVTTPGPLCQILLVPMPPITAVIGPGPGLRPEPPVNSSPVFNPPAVPYTRILRLAYGQNEGRVDDSRKPHQPGSAAPAREGGGGQAKANEGRGLAACCTMRPTCRGTPVTATETLCRENRGGGWKHQSATAAINWPSRKGLGSSEEVQQRNLDCVHSGTRSYPSRRAECLDRQASRYTFAVSSETRSVRTDGHRSLGGRIPAHV